MWGMPELHAYGVCLPAHMWGMPACTHVGYACLHARMWGMHGSGSSEHLQESLGPSHTHLSRSTVPWPLPPVDIISSGSSCCSAIVLRGVDEQLLPGGLVEGVGAVQEAQHDKQAGLCWCH